MSSSVAAAWNTDPVGTRMTPLLTPSSLTGENKWGTRCMHIPLSPCHEITVKIIQEAIDNSCYHARTKAKNGDYIPFVTTWNQVFHYRSGISVWPHKFMAKSLVPRPPQFIPSICVHNNTRERKTSKKWGRSGSIHHMSGRKVDVGRGGGLIFIIT